MLEQKNKSTFSATVWRRLLSAIGILCLISGIAQAQVIDLGQDFETNAVVQLEYAFDGSVWGITSSTLERMPTIAGVYTVRSTDRGATWDTSCVTSNWWRWGVDLCPIDLNTAYALTLRVDTTELYRTTDGGASWEELTLKDVKVERIVLVQFFSPMTGVILGSVGRTIERKWVISRTTDGGKTWRTQLPMLPEPPIETLAEYNDRSQEVFGGAMYIGMSKGRLLVTLDSGATWSFIKTGLTGEVNTVTALPDGRIMAVHALERGNQAVASADGKSWYVVKLPNGTPPLHGTRTLRNQTFLTLPNPLTKSTLGVLDGYLGKFTPLSEDELYSALHFDVKQILCGTELLPGKGLFLQAFP